jgi:S1-C subfamily serine protease
MKLLSTFIAVMALSACSGCGHTLTHNELAWVQDHMKEAHTAVEFDNMAAGAVELRFFGETPAGDQIGIVATGTLIDAHRVLTAAHVTTAWISALLAGATLTPILVVDHANKKVYPLELAAGDVREDLALLTSEEGLPGKPVTLATASPHLGETVYMIGANGTTGGVDLKTGVIARYMIERSLASEEMVLGRFFVNAAISPGNSGGPVFNARGELVGIMQNSMPSTVVAENTSIPVLLGGVGRIEKIKAFLAASEKK